VTDASQEPAWVAPEIFPPKPESDPYGVVGGKGRPQGFATFEELEEYVALARNEVGAIWTPESERTMPMEGEPRLVEALRKRFRRIAEVDFSNGRRGLLLYGAVFVWALVYAWSVRGQVPMMQSQALGLSGLLLVMLGLAPTYEAWKLRRESLRMKADDLRADEREARFDYWLSRQKMPATMALLGLIAMVAAGQVVIGWEGSWAINWEPSVQAAGLLKGEAFAAWRMWTAPFLHGGWFHLILNGVALWILGRRAETLAGWPHLVMVYLVSAWVGGFASAKFLPGFPSVGASGGILGLLGFLLVFETLHARLAPRSARRRLLAAVVMTFVIGVVAQAFIDNAAHAGGLVAGMIYAVVVFPRSFSARRPRATKMDLLLGGLSLFILAASALQALRAMLAS